MKKNTSKFTPPKKKTGKSPDFQGMSKKKGIFEDFHHQLPFLFQIAGGSLTARRTLKRGTVSPNRNVSSFPTIMAFRGFCCYPLVFTNKSRHRKSENPHLSWLPSKMLGIFHGLCHVSLQEGKLRGGVKRSIAAVAFQPSTIEGFELPGTLLATDLVAPPLCF